MSTSSKWESLDVHLLQVLYALLSESSVSNAARRLNQSQPAVSTSLRRLREITGDQLLVRSRNGMIPTERGQALLEPVRTALSQIEAIGIQQVRFDPSQSRRVYNLATPDYLSAVMLGEMMSRIRRLAPNSQVILHSLGPDFNYSNALETGMLDGVIANWPQPPEHLRLAPLFEDEVVCLMRKAHPLAGQTLTKDTYLNAEHLVPTPYTVGQRGVIDLHLAKERLKRNVVVYVPYFNMVPYMLMQMDAVFSAPRIFAEHFCSLMPLKVSDIPIDFPPIPFYLLWHDRSHHSEECRWFREQVIAVMRDTKSAYLRPQSTPAKVQAPLSTKQPAPHVAYA
ncbi:LysR substrate-binding domain-containing protein [Aquirhabdus sp.]|uniref:LysR substrate-binding domain-containing protein n=1 Tax=Aquirhabdus sp. TaxID=2824160 RepID=UPI00396CE522